MKINATAYIHVLHKNSNNVPLFYAVIKSFAVLSHLPLVMLDALSLMRYVSDMLFEYNVILYFLTVMMK